jgi:hypothetical protein
MSFAALLIRASLPQPSITWQTFTEARKTELIEQGATVLVFARPSYHPLSELSAAQFDHPDIKKSFHAGRFEALLLEYDDWDEVEIHLLFKNYGHTKKPIILLFSPNQEHVWIEPHTSEELLTHIPRASSTIRSQTLWATLMLISLVGCVVVGP